MPQGKTSSRASGRLPLALVATFALALGSSANAATPDSYRAVDRASEVACLQAAGLNSASAGPVTRFSDRARMDARVIRGTWPQPRMKGASVTMLCLYDRRTRRAEVQELAGGDAGVAAPAAAIAQIKDRQWRVVEISGRPPVSAGKDVTLMFGSDGHIAASGGCNGFGGRYMLTGEGLKIYGPMIGTQMACAPQVMEQERRMQEILSAAQSLTPRPDGQLLLTAGDGRTMLLRPIDQSAAPPRSAVNR